jgi:hypothetical protein
MNIYLQHDVHGTKVATMELEAVADEENGWTRFDPAAVAVVESAPEANALETKRRRKPVVEEAVP